MLVHINYWTVQLHPQLPAEDQGGQQGGPLHLLHISRAARGRAQDSPVDLLPATHAAHKLE